MRVALLTLALAACSAPAATQNEAGDEAPAAVTAEKAASLPPDRLADLVFRELGVRMTAVSRRLNPPGVITTPLYQLTFAGAPHGTGSVGLCAAMRARVEFGGPVPQPGSVGGPASPATPMQVIRIRAADVYKVTGPIEPYVQQSQDRGAEEDRRCTAAGPVIPSVEDDLSRPYYFTFEGEAIPELSLLVLQRAIAEAQAGRYRTVSCAASARSAPECRNPAALLGGLNMGNLVSLQIALPGLSGNRNVVRARFLIPGAPRAQLYWSVAMEVDIARPPDAEERIERLGRTEIARSGPSPS